MKLVMRKDAAVSSEYIHYVIGKVGDDVAGGIYVRKSVKLPDVITIEVKKEKKED